MKFKKGLEKKIKAWKIFKKSNKNKNKKNQEII